MYLISLYAPENNKQQHEKGTSHETFLNTLEYLKERINLTPPPMNDNDRIIILGDFNARVGNHVISGKGDI